MPSLKYTPEIKQFLIEHYPIETTDWCVEKLGSEFSNHGLNIYCCRQGIKKKKLYEGKESFDVSIFQNPSTPIVAYFLGLIWGDGNIDLKSGRINLTLVEEDAAEIFDTIKYLGFFSVKRKQPPGNRKPVLIIRACNRKLCDFLEEMDYAKKSIVSPSKILERIPLSLQRFFWLGFWDADGCWYVGETTSNFFVSGSYDQSWDDLLSFLEKIGCSWHYRQQSRTSGYSSSVTLTDKLSKRIIGSVLYKSIETDKIGLLRKFKKFQTFEENLSESVDKRRSRATVFPVKIWNETKYRFYFQNKKFTFTSYDEAVDQHDKMNLEKYGLIAKTLKPLDSYFPHLFLTYYLSFFEESLAGAPQDKFLQTI